MPAFLAAATPILARAALAAIFLYSGYLKLLHPANAASRLAAHHLPAAGALALAAGVLEVAAGAALVLGFRTRGVALALAVYLLAVSWLFHFGGAVHGDGAQLVQLLKNAGLVGGMLLLATHGPGTASVDRG